MPALQGIGILLVIVAVIAVIYALLQNSKAGKIKTVPFKKPSEISQAGAAAGDAKGLCSSEGQVTGQPIVAPMSGQPCVYYEIEVIRGYHKTTTNSQGHTSKTHSTKSVLDQKQGTVFGLTDGQGAVGVDCTKKPSFDLKQSHRNRVNIGLIVPGTVQFGNMTMQTEHLAANIAGVLLGGETTDYYEGVERIVPFQQGQTLYALGKLSQGPQGWQLGDPGGLSSLMLSDKGREGALGTAVKNAKIAFIVAAVTFVGGGVMTGVGFAMAPAETPKPAQTAAATTSTPAGDTGAPTNTAAPAGTGAKPTTPTKPATATPAATTKPSTAPTAAPKPTGAPKGH